MLLKRMGFFDIFMFEPLGPESSARLFSDFSRAIWGPSGSGASTVIAVHVSLVKQAL